MLAAVPSQAQPGRYILSTLSSGRALCGRPATPGNTEPGSGSPDRREVPRAPYMRLSSLIPPSVVSVTPVWSCQPCWGLAALSFWVGWIRDVVCKLATGKSDQADVVTGTTSHFMVKFPGQPEIIAEVFCVINSAVEPCHCLWHGFCGKMHSKLQLDFKVFTPNNNGKVDPAFSFSTETLEGNWRYGKRYFQTLPWSIELWQGVPSSDWLCGGGGERDRRRPQHPGRSEAQLSVAPRPVLHGRWVEQPGSWHYYSPWFVL